MPQPQRIEIPAGVAYIFGDVSLLRDRRKVALISSQRCSGDVILKTYDFARLVRRSGFAIASGFHSPIEMDCLPVLIPYAAPGSKTECLALELLAAGKCVYTFESGASTSLSSHGAVVVSPESLSSHCKAGFREAKLTDAAYNKS